MASKVAKGYTRHSQGSDTSIPTQKENIRGYAEEHGFDLREVLNDGRFSSGFKPDQLDEYHNLTENIKDGELDAVIINSKRRIVRDENEVMRLIANLRSNGVELHSCQDGQVDLSEPMNAAIEILRAASAAEEKRNEIERSKQEIQKKQARGDYLGRPRYGTEYSADKRRLVPNGEFENVVATLWERAAGASFPTIEDRVGVNRATAMRIWNRREWYIELARQG